MNKVLCVVVSFFVSFLSLGQTSHYVEVGGGGQAGAAYYSPQHIIINVGDTVIWENVQGTHNVDGRIQTFPNNPENFYSGSPQGAPWTFSFVFNSSGIYDYECNQGNHNLTQFGTVTVSTSLNLTCDNNIEYYYFNNSILYFNDKFLPVSFKVYSISGNLIYDFQNYSNTEFNLNNMQNSGLYILSLFDNNQKLISNSIFMR